jgi:hypothetical protein
MMHGSPAESDALAQIAAVIGEEAAHRFARAFGGTTVYIRREIGEGDPIYLAIGGAAAAKLAAFYGGSRLNVPKRAARQAWVRELLDQGTLTITAIAMVTGYSERQVYRLKGGRDDERQLDLFGG